MPQHHLRRMVAHPRHRQAEWRPIEPRRQAESHLRVESRQQEEDRMAAPRPQAAVSVSAAAESGSDQRR